MGMYVVGNISSIQIGGGLKGRSSLVHTHMNNTKKVGREGAGFVRESEQAVHEAKPWLDTLARMGYCAKGTVNVVIGLLAVLTAVGAGGEITDTKGALAAIGAQPFVLCFF
jgi:hypothetical protein